MTRKQVKLLVLRMLKALGAFRAARWLTRKRVRILGYHGIWLGDARFPGDGLFMLPATFRRRLEMLCELGHPVVPLDVALDGLAGILPLPPCAVVISIDDAWLGTVVEMWPALRAADMPATLYADTRKLLRGGTIEHVAERYVARYGEHARESGTCDYMSLAELRQAHTEGLDVQLHTHSHSMRGFDSDDVREEIERNRDALGLILDTEPAALRHLAYPSGKCDPALKPVLEDAGVASAATVRRALARSDDDPHFLPRLLDSERVGEIEFEAELCGVLELLRTLRPHRMRGEIRYTKEPRLAAGEPPERLAAVRSA